MTKEQDSGGVQIGDVTGGIHGAIIAGGNVQDVHMGGGPATADQPGKELDAEAIRHASRCAFFSLRRAMFVTNGIA